MANQHRGYVDVTLDKQRRFKFDLNALTELEDALGKPVTQLNDGTVGMRELRAMIWAGLLHESPDLTLRETGDIIDLERIEEITEKVTEAMTAAFPQGGGKNGKGGPGGIGQRPSTSHSGRSL
ncbi:gene transfer agent family protein [Paludifilum halophilum]|uniref:gene transfer agent family protein n=1 Tax=Paludifilum halophilum TaxID=1642702 RepID=UPI001F0A5270|nr:gene transfer agent family protein [Paludifilum halophilum]